MAKKEHPDEDKRPKSRAVPQHQATCGARTRYHEAAACSTTHFSAVEKDPEWKWANTEHMLGDLKKHVKTMNDFIDINRRLSLIGMPNDELATRVGNDAFETTIKTVKKRERIETGVEICGLFLKLGGEVCLLKPVSCIFHWF